MRASRLLLLVVALGVGAWLYLSSSKNLLQTHGEGDASTPSLERARAAARTSASRNAEAAGAQSAVDGAGTGAITENMTPDQVRALLGPPSDTQTETLDTGVRRETWTYRDVGKTVVFENGVVASIR